MNLRLPFIVGSETCPYCFEEYALSSTPFRCTSPGSICPWEQDPVANAKWKQGAPVGRVVPAQRFARSVRCSACGHETRKRLCPHCHMELPPMTGECRNLIFAVIGAKAAGKSHYIAVLINQIRQRVGPDLDILLEPVDDRTMKRYRADFYEPVYGRGEIIQATRSAVEDNRVQLPLVYSLSFSGHDLMGRTKIGKTVSVVFFDTAGEDLDDADLMSTVNKYIYRANGIILLLDPLQLPTVRDQLGPGTALPERNTESADIVTRATNLILAGRKLRPNATVETPMAVAFSKFDAVESLIDPQFQLRAAASHRGGFDAADFAAVNGEMQSLLSEWDGEVLLHQVRTRYRRYGFFGLSALGCNPHGTNRIPNVFPRRVEDPFLWLLHEHGLLRAAAKR
ncbi:MAG: hypothetical protein QOD51_2677 [Candidatus Eremiobacteraeota bacterium]|nr:hypothetical protein [Candidatus Eremiobacteraeota bacterium]